MKYTNTEPQQILYEDLVESWILYRLQSMPFTIYYRENFVWYYL